MSVPSSSISASKLVGFPKDSELSYNPTRSFIGDLADSSETDFAPVMTQTAVGEPETQERTESFKAPVIPASLPGPGTIPLIRGLAFNLKRKVGQGAFGEVWEATQSTLGRTVAVKRLRNSIFLGEEDRVEKVRLLELEFRQEALTTARPDHPNIVPVHDVSHDEMGRLMIAMKLVRGVPWKKMIDEDFGNLTVQDFLAKHLQILVSVSQAVAFAHSRCVIHRDLKPQQVMVGKFGEVMLMDWGLAMTYGTAEMMADITQFSMPTSQIPEIKPVNPAGTPAFMAPEQTDADVSRIGPWTDIYLLGGTLYFLLTRTYPHFSADANIAFELARNGEVSRPEERNPKREVPPELSDLCMHAMNPDIRKRMQNAEQFIKALEEYLSGSGHRRESTDLVRKAQVILAQQTKSYDSLSECSLLLARATGLWSDNPQAKELKQAVIKEFANTAMANNDLLLAKLQAERLDDRKVADKILKEINDRHDSMREKVLKPRILTPARVAILMVAQAISALAVFLMVRAAEQAVFDECKSKAREIAILVAGQINPADLGVIREKADMESPEFTRVLSILQRVRGTSGDVRNVYAMRPDPAGTKDKFLYVVNSQPQSVDTNGDGKISDEEKGIPTGLPFDATGSNMREGLYRPFVESDFAYDRTGTLLSAYAPVLDRGTKTPVAILGVDIDAEAVKDKMSSINLAGIVAGGILVLLITGAVLASYNLLRSMEVNRTLDQEIRRQDSQLQRGNISLS
jgi:serine/threonine protein kinase